MAIDNNSLCYLFDSIFQIENIAGKPVVGGHIEVFVAGTDQKYITWQNFDGTKNPFKIPLNNDGRAVVLVEPHYTYDIYIYDSFNNMICSRLNVKPAIGGDVTVYGLTEVWHDGTMSGEGTPQSPLSVVSAGKVYDGIEPIVVNNIENKISANHVPLGVQDPLYFVQDDEEGCIIGFSGQTVPEGVMTESALGFEDNKITGYNGSAFSAGNEYEAGSYVDIDNNTINVTGLQPEGDYAYNSALSSKLDVTALPQDLVHSGDLTAYQPVGDYQTAGNYLSATDSANFLLTSDSGNFYPMTGNPSGFLTAHQSLQGYATEQWVEDKGYITGIDIQESAGWNEATTVVNNNSAIWNNTTNVVSSNSAQWGATNPQIPVTGINGIKISESGDKVVFEVSADYALADDLTGKQDSLAFGYKDAAVSSIDNSALYDNSAHARITTLAGRISDLSSNKLDTTAFSDVSGDFYTTANESGFVTTAELQTVSGEITALIPTALTGDYVEKSAINTITGDNGEYTWTAITGIDNVWISASEAGYATRASTAATATWADNALYAEAAANWAGASGKLDNSASANFYTTANESGFISEVPAGTMNESAFEYDANDKISGYNGSAFAGGSDVPEGVMVESGLEYNAVNEISGYNGSAIAQYGAEKQWLVHDDTIVHVANSAQYAFGVNLSAVAQLLGVDETVLWSGDAYNNITASEPLTGFKRVRLKVSNNVDSQLDYGSVAEYREIDPMTLDHDFTIAVISNNGKNSVNKFLAINTEFSATNNFTEINSIHTYQVYNSSGTWATGANNTVRIKEIIGIGRKA